MLNSNFYRYIAQIEDLMTRGAAVSAVGMQGHLGPDPIDLAKVEDTVTRVYTKFGLPIWITEFDWKSQEYSECLEISNNHTQHAIELDNFFRLCLRYEIIRENAI